MLLINLLLVCLKEGDVLGFRTVLIESPSKCTYQGGYMIVQLEDDVHKIHLSEISSIVLSTQRIFLSAYLLSELSKNKISLVVSDEKHNPIGQYLPLYGSHNTSSRIVEQLSWSLPTKKRVWQKIIQEKIFHQAELLSLIGLDDKSEILYSYSQDVHSGDSTNREAVAAKYYFSTLFGTDFCRDDNTPLNATLNYGYSILMSTVSREIVSRGYLTQTGICHRSEFNQYNFACDLMEPFRSVIDKAVVYYFEGDFTKEIRHRLIDLVNTEMTYKEGRYKLSSIISGYVQDCINALNKKISVSEISSFELS